MTRQSGRLTCLQMPSHAANNSNSPPPPQLWSKALWCALQHSMSVHVLVNAGVWLRSCADELFHAPVVPSLCMIHGCS